MRNFSCFVPDGKTKSYGAFVLDLSCVPTAGRCDGTPPSCSTLKKTAASAQKGWVTQGRQEGERKQKGCATRPFGNDSAGIWSVQRKLLQYRCGLFPPRPARDLLTFVCNRHADILIQWGGNGIANSGTISDVGVQYWAKTFRPDGTPRSTLNAGTSLRLHWPEYLMEAAELALYMLLACAFATLLQHPASPVRQVIVDGFSRRVLMGLAIGATVVGIIMTPWGKQSGGHFNPAITFAFYRLGKVGPWDALFYATGQFLGAIGGVAIATYMLGGAPSNDAVRYAMTLPGVYGDSGAFVGELTISFILMTTILVATNRETLARYTPYFVGTLYAAFSTFETPLSGMSMNPARSLGSAFLASYWHALWIYFIAPTVGMLGAAEVFLRARGGVPPYCAKLHHDNNKRCIFHHSESEPRGIREKRQDVG